MAYNDSGFDPTKWISTARRGTTRKRRQTRTTTDPNLPPGATPITNPTLSNVARLGQSEGTGSSTLAPFQTLVNTYGGAAQNPNAQYLANIGASPTSVTALPGGEGGNGRK